MGEFGPDLTEFKLNLAVCGPTLADVGQFRAKFDPVRANFGRFRSIAGQFSSNLDGFGPTLDNNGLEVVDLVLIDCEPNFGQRWSKLVDFVRIRPKVCRTRTCPRQIGQFVPNLGAFGPNSTDFQRIWHHLGQIRPGFGQILGDFDRIWPGLGNHRPPCQDVAWPWFRNAAGVSVNPTSSD